MSCCGGHEEKMPVSQFRTCGKCGMALSETSEKCFICGWDGGGEVAQQKTMKAKRDSSKETSAEGQDGETSEDDDDECEDECCGAEHHNVLPVKKPSLLRRLMAFLLVVTWLSAALGRIDTFKVKGKPISVLDPVLESGLRVAKPRGFTQQAEAIFHVLGMPAAIPNAIKTSNLYAGDMSKFLASTRKETEAGTRKWVKENKLKNVIPSTDNALPLASVSMFLSIFTAISFPKYGSLLFAVSFIVMYSVLNMYDPSVKVLEAGWGTMLVSVLAFFLTPERSYR